MDYGEMMEQFRKILDMLKKASESFNPDASSDVLKKDPIFRSGSGTTSDIIKWRKFANTLRLEVAMRATNIAPGLAEQHARECMEHEDWIIASLDDMVAPAWGSDVSNDVSYYYNRFLKKLIVFHTCRVPNGAEFYLAGGKLQSIRTHRTVRQNMNRLIPVYWQLNGL